jgi:hypothetical protein
MRAFISRLLGARATSERRTTPAPGTRLGLESLDRRDLPSITWVAEGGFFGGRIEIVGDTTNDIVSVSNKANNLFDPYDDQVVVNRLSGGAGPDGLSTILETGTFNRYLNLSGLHIPRINHVVVTLGDG